MVGCDDERAGVGHGAAHLGQALVGCREHGRDPFAVGVQGGSPRLGGDVLGEAFAEVCRHFFTGGGAPTHLARVRHEDDRAHHVVFQRGTVTVGVVRLGAADTVIVDLVGDERNRGGIRTERGTGQRHAAGRVVEGLAQAVTPGEGVSGVVNLVKNNEGFRRLSVARVQLRLIRHLRVGQRHALVVAADGHVRVLKVRVNRNTDLRGGVRPLLFQVVGRRHNDELAHRAAVEEFLGEGEREGGFTRTGGCHGHEVAGVLFEVLLHGFCLPGAQADRSTPGGAVGVCRGELRLHHTVE